MTIIRYRTADILDALDVLRASLETGEINAHDYRFQLCLFQFRDDTGAYWALDARKKWYCFADEGWKAASHPPEHMEGLSWLQPFTPLEKPITENDVILDELDDLPADEALVALADSIRKAYAQGRLTSSEAEALLTQRYVFDKQGTPWTIGLRRGDWYHFQENRWITQPRPLSDSLLRVERVQKECVQCGSSLQGAAVCPKCGTPISPQIVDASEQAYASIYAFLISGAGTLPEAMTAPWDPPAWFPEAIDEAAEHCSMCDATNPSLSRYCNRCGAMLDQSTPEASSPLAMERTCPVCKATVKAGRKFCTKCGASLTITSEQAGGR